VDNIEQDIFPKDENKQKLVILDELISIEFFVPHFLLEITHVTEVQTDVAPLIIPEN